MRILQLFLILCVVGCSSNEEKKMPTRGELAAQIPPSMRAQKSLDDDEFEPDLESGKSVAEPSFGGEPAKQDNLPNAFPALPDASDLVWTDPDNPDQNLGSIEAVFTQPVKDPWQQSYRSAQRLAFAEGKALMIWFTDSRSSPTCKMLSRDLFSRPDFESWSEDKIIKLRVDNTPRERDREAFSRKQKYAQALRKKFGVKGNPNVLVIGLKGQTAGRYSGYRSGSGDYFWGQIKNAVKTVDDQHFDWRDGLEKKGYRHWTGRNGVKLFARLLRYKEGRLQVVEPNGRKTIFNEQNLSPKDREWIREQKAARE